MQWLAAVCVKRPTFAAVLMLIITVLGIEGYSRLGVDRFPNVDFPFVIVTTILPGASPEDVEQTITDPIEAAVNTVGAIDELRSVSAEGVSLVIVQFDLGVDVNDAAQDVRDRVGRVTRELPDGTEPPVIAKLDPDAVPVLFATVKAPGRPVRQVTEVADTTVRTALESIKGVGQVKILGGEDRAVNVWVDPVKLRSLGMSAGELARAIGTQNLTVPGGRVDTGRDQLTLRVHGKVARAEDVAGIAVRTMGDRVIRVGDVARVEDGVEEPQNLAMWNGEEAVVLAISKQSGSNTVAVADALRERAARPHRRPAPRLDRLDVIRDESAPIRTSTDGVTEHLVVGVAARGGRRVVVPRLRALDHHRRARDPDLGARHVRGDEPARLHAEHHHPAGARAVGRHRDRRRHRRPREHRPAHRREGQDADGRGGRGAPSEIGLAVMATTLSLVAVFLPVVFLLAGIPGGSCAASASRCRSPSWCRCS
jgi:HAE1 family hydrophobic/amphiphilic exporter-1